MAGWLKALLTAAVVMVGLWALLVMLAARLPPGLLKDLAGFLPACVTLVRRLRADPRVPWQAKAAVTLAGLWVLSPIDLLPEFLPVIGPPASRSTRRPGVAGLVAAAVFLLGSCSASWDKPPREARR